MSYRNGTYVAFDGNDTTDPTKSDMKYYGILQSWNANKNINFTFSDSHKKTYQVKDSSSIKTLKSRLLERMKDSKNMIIIISDDTNWDRGMLNFEIEEAVDYYKLPLIIAYTKYEKIRNASLLSEKWPRALKERINNGNAKCIHVPFKKEPILDAISQFSVNDKFPSTSKNVYSEEAYKSWGIK
jgi:hypothetical protein